jgi:hypothetical protein
MTSVPLKLESAGLELYSFYLHPIDISAAARPPLPKGIGPLKRRRMDYGRGSMEGKLRKLIALLRARGFQFTTYRDLITTLHQNQWPQNVVPMRKAASRGP